MKFNRTDILINEFSLWLLAERAGRTNRERCSFTASFFIHVCIYATDWRRFRCLQLFI